MNQTQQYVYNGGQGGNNNMFFNEAYENEAEYNPIGSNSMMLGGGGGMGFEQDSHVQNPYMQNQ
jgi:hypothetical protein